MSDRDDLATDGRLLGSAAAPVVVIDREYDATPAEVWAAWTRPEQLRRWLGAVAAPLDTPGVPVPVALVAEELPADPATADNPATFTVRTARPPTDEAPGVLELVFDDRADPGGLLTVTVAAAGEGRCRLGLRHALLPRAEAVEQAPDFGAGWEGFLDWLADVLAGRPHGGGELYEAVTPSWARLGVRLRRTTPGRLVKGRIVHERVLATPVEAVWSLLSTAAGLGRWLGGATETGTVETWEPPYRLGMSWRPPAEEPSYVLVELAPAPEGTALRLEHSGVAPGLREGHRTGWHAHLDLLVAEAEGYGVPRFSDALAAAGGSPG